MNEHQLQVPAFLPTQHLLLNPLHLVPEPLPELAVDGDLHSKLKLGLFPLVVFLLLGEFGRQGVAGGGGSVERGVPDREADSWGGRGGETGDDGLGTREGGGKGRGEEQISVEALGPDG
jgi:hypothetical protein